MPSLDLSRSADRPADRNGLFLNGVALAAVIAVLHHSAATAACSAVNIETLASHESGNKKLVRYIIVAVLRQRRVFAPERTIPSLLRYM